MSRASKVIHDMGHAIWIPIFAVGAAGAWYFEKFYVKPKAITPSGDGHDYYLRDIRDENGKLLAYRKVSIKKGKEPSANAVQKQETKNM